jgi:Cu/Ag efflux pump CusA
MSLRLRWRLSPRREDRWFRPILLTSLTTIAGLLPTAIGLGGESPVWGPMAGTIILGLIFSTITALFFVPSLYGALYDRKAKKTDEASTAPVGAGSE